MSESDTPNHLRVSFFTFIRHFGLAAAFRHYRRLAWNRIFNTATKNMGATYRLVSLLPLLLGGVISGVLLSRSFADVWWQMLSVLIGLSALVIGAAGTASMVFVNVMFFRHVANLALWSFSRLALVVAVFVGAGLMADATSDRVLLVLTASCLYFVSAPITRRVQYLVLWHRAQPAMRKRISWEKKRFSEEQVYRTCVHEAGHAIGYCLLRTLPEDACAGISLDTESTIGGYAWGLWKVSALDTTDELADMILIQLAGGTIAEEIVLGTRSYGDSDDMEKFEQILKIRVSHLFESGYKVKPENDVERMHNLRIERRNRKAIYAHVRALVTENQDLIKEIAAELQRKEFLDSVELMPYWRRMSLTPGLKKIDVPAHVPCWPEADAAEVLSGRAPN